VEKPELIENSEKIVGLLARLHAASFTQGSLNLRNIVVQPGPLTLPREERSLDEPSFRILDFGRGSCPGVNCTIERFAIRVEGERRGAISLLGFDTKDYGRVDSCIYGSLK